MKARIITIITTFALVIVFGSQAANAAPADIASVLEDKLVCHVEQSDYLDGDCLLTSTRTMIRRAAIMRQNEDWADITNASLRPEATEDGLMRSSFSYSDDSIRYTIANGEFEGEDNATRINEFRELLKQHPEGIVVFGAEAAENGSHGVLVVKVEDGAVYAVDSATNTGDLNEGVQLWKDTIMLDPSLCTDYWYISEITGGSLTLPPEMRHFDPLRPNIVYI